MDQMLKLLRRKLLTITGELLGKVGFIGGNCVGEASVFLADTRIMQIAVTANQIVNGSRPISSGSLTGLFRKLGKSERKKNSTICAWNTKRFEKSDTYGYHLII